MIHGRPAASSVGLAGKRGASSTTMESPPAPTTCADLGQRLADAGVTPLLLTSIMRNSELSTSQRYYLRNDAAKESEQLEAYLVGTVAPQEPTKKSQPSDVSPELA